MQTYLGEAAVSNKDFCGAQLSSAAANSICHKAAKDISEDSLPFITRKEDQSPASKVTNLSIVTKSSEDKHIVENYEDEEEAVVAKVYDPQPGSPTTSELSLLTPLETDEDGGYGSASLSLLKKMPASQNSNPKEGSDEANIFGPTIPLYSISGPPGGVFIGTGFVQSDPADNGRVSVIVRLEPNIQFVVEPGSSGRTRKSTAEKGKSVANTKHPKAKRRIKRIESLEDFSASDLEEGPSAPRRYANTTSRTVSSSRLPTDENFSGPPKRKPVTVSAPVKKSRRIIGEFERDTDPKMLQRMCHQCRNAKSTYAKMLCGSVKDNGVECRNVYCHRCISTRYPGISFKSRKRFQCPKCMDTCNCDVCTKRRGEPYYKTEELQKLMAGDAGAEASDDPVQQNDAIVRDTPRLNNKKSGDSVSDAEIEVESSTKVDSRQDKKSRKSSPLSRRRSFIGEDLPPNRKARKSDEKTNGKLTKFAEDASISSTDLVNSQSRRRLYVGDANELRRKPSSTANVPTSVPTSVPEPTDDHHADSSKPIPLLETTRTRSGRNVRQRNHYAPVDLESDDSYFEPSRPKKKRRVSSKRSIPADGKRPKSKAALVPSEVPRSPSDVEDDNQVQLLLGSPLSSELSEPDLDLQYPCEESISST